MAESVITILFTSPLPVSLVILGVICLAVAITGYIPPHIQGGRTYALGGLGVMLILGAIGSAWVLASVAPRAPGQPPTAPACSIGETVIIPFTGGTYAAQTLNSYSGTIIVTVSGTGQAAGTQYSDAFYFFTDTEGKQIDPKYPAGWVLRINGQLASDMIPGQQVPSYNSDHVYTFNVNAPDGKLTFGVSDVTTSDNTGSYTIVLCQP